MAEHTQTVPEEPPPSLAPYASLLTFGFFNATTWMVALGTPMILLASQLGASSFEVGLVYAFVFLLLPLQILATATLPRFGYKKQILFAWSVRTVFLLVPLYLAFLAPEEPRRWMVHALVLSSFLFCLFRSLGSCAVMPLIYATLPEAIRGRYFSTDQAINAVSGILTLLFCAALFRWLPIYQAFLWQYGYALVGAGLAVFFMARVADPPKPAHTTLGAILDETPRICLRPSPFRQYLGFMTVHALMGTAFVPLKAYYLKTEAGIGMDWILVYTAIQFGGAILGTLLIRNRIDRIGVKPVYRAAFLLGACVSTYWFLFVSGVFPGLDRLLPAAYFVFGLSASLLVTAHLKYIPRVCDEARQALHVSVHGAFIGIIGGFAPMFWGFFVKLPDAQPGVRGDHFVIFFAFLITAQLVLFFYVPRLTSRHRDRPSLQTGSFLLRPIRYIGHLVNTIPERKR